MKKNYSLFLFLTFFYTASLTLYAQSVELKFVSKTNWHAADGIPYTQVPGFNFGAISFEMMNDAEIAFLANASNEIIITDRTTGNRKSSFPVCVAPRDFVFDNEVFYVLNDKQVTMYNKSGQLVNNVFLPQDVLGVERLARYANETYLLLPSGNSLKIESNGRPVTPETHTGWITSAGLFAYAKIATEKEYSVNVITANGIRYEKSFTADKKVAGVYVVGATANQLLLDVQTFLSESPITVSRNIVSINLSENGLSSYRTSIAVPDCYYVFSNKDFYVSKNGKLLNMVTSPQATFILSLNLPTMNGGSYNYPKYISDIKYHYNDHLLKIDGK